MQHVQVRMDNGNVLDILAPGVRDFTIIPKPKTKPKTTPESKTKPEPKTKPELKTKTKT